MRLGPGHQAARRPPRGRPGVGAAEPGPGPRQARVPEAHQLEGGRRRRRQPGRRQRHQGVRHRVLHGGLPPADGGARPGRVPRSAGSPGARPRRPPRAGLPGQPDPDLRRRRQRGPARPDRPVRRSACPASRGARTRHGLHPHRRAGAIRDLRHRILREQLPPERLRELEAERRRWFAADVWAALAKADLLGLSLPEADGGGGYGLLEACLDRRAGRPHRRPASRTCRCIVGAGAADRRVRHGRAAGQLLPGVVAGDTHAHRGARRAATSTCPAVPATAATPVDDGWRLDGEKAFVAAADRAAAILVPARTGEDASAVFLVDPAGRRRRRSTARVGRARRAPVDGPPDGVAVGDDRRARRVDGGADDRAAGSSTG